MKIEFDKEMVENAKMTESRKTSFPKEQVKNADF